MGSNEEKKSDQHVSVTHRVIAPAELHIRSRSSVSFQVDRDEPAIILQSIIESVANVDDGFLVRAVGIPWLEISQALDRGDDILQQFHGKGRDFEEFLAACYDQAGFDEVILTPRSGDGGRDVVATKHGFGSIRILEQAKAYSPGHLVNHDDVRAMLGVLQTDPNASKGIITTTSDFQPQIISGPEFQPFMPHRLELKNGKQLAEWIQQIAKGDAS